MPQHSDVVIVGGGIAGCSLAYALSQRGIKPLILERDEIAAHASGAAAGLLTPSSEVKERGPVYAFAQEALRMHASLANRLRELTGFDVLYQEQPVLRLAFSEEDAAEMREQLEWEKELRWVDPPELSRLEPCANPSALGAVYAEHEARVDSWRLVSALAGASVRNGTVIQPGRVVGLTRAGDRVTSVHLADGQSISGETFVFATGSWASEAGTWLDFPLSIQPMRGQILVLRSKWLLRHVLFSGSNYVLPQSDGCVLAGTTQEWAGFDDRVTPEGQAFILRELRIMAPALVGAEIIKSRSGLRPVSQDSLPIVGRAPGWENAYLSVGYGRKGILMGPLIGKYLADFILEGPAPSALRPFDPQRLLAKTVSS